MRPYLSSNNQTSDNPKSFSMSRDFLIVFSWIKAVVLNNCSEKQSFDKTGLEKNRNKKKEAHTACRSAVSCRILWRRLKDGSKHPCRISIAIKTKIQISSK